jgi:hypothetical protein
VTPALAAKTSPMAWLEPDAMPPVELKTSEPVAVVRLEMAESASVAAQSQRPGAPAKFFVNVSVRVWAAPTESRTSKVAT